MGISYTPVPIGIADLIKNSTHDAIYLIPDLQRPYVWKPNQVVLLIDSLFRGWPFGSLLTWEVKSDSYGANGIPPRAFWHIVDRTNEKEDHKALPKGQPATYFMILDGQQRIQSMLLALGGDMFGFKLHDHDWFAEREVRRPITEHWTQGSLHLNISSFMKEMDDHDNELSQINMGSILDWVLTNKGMQSNAPKAQTYEDPLKKLWEHPNQFIRFSRLWDLSEKGSSELRYEQDLPNFLTKQEIAIDTHHLLIRRLAILLRTISEIKYNTQIQTLQINSLTITPQWSVDDYNDAIVNIFTRLNTAGRTLTREEITLAWIKVGWDPQFNDGNKSAGQCLDELISIFKEERIEVSMDELVRLLSFFWAVQKRQGILLTDRDLLKGDVIRPMAGDLSKEWNSIKSTLIFAAKIVNDRDLVGSTESFNALIVCWCWLFIADQWGYYHQRNMGTRNDDAYCKKIDELFSEFLDQWVFNSQWANTWSLNAVKNLQTFAKTLSSYSILIKEEVDFNKAYSALTDSTNELLKEVQPAAENYIRSFTVTNRSRVSQYRGILWVWQRLNEERFEKSMILLKSARQRKLFTPEVDHTIADAYWKERVANEIQRLKEDGMDFTVPEGLPEKGPIEFESRQKAEQFINTIGNCSLLRKGFNISKGKEPMWNFLKEIKEFKEGIVERSKWEEALSMSEKMTSPENFSFSDLVQVIKDRDVKMRNDISDFIYGRQKRRDV